MTMAINKNVQTSEKNHSSTADREFNSIKDDKKQRGISNSGGQQSFQTDNKQGSVNRGNQNPNVQGKNNAKKKQSDK